MNLQAVYSIAVVPKVCFVGLEFICLLQISWYVLDLVCP